MVLLSAALIVLGAGLLAWALTRAPAVWGGGDAAAHTAFAAAEAAGGAEQAADTRPGAASGEAVDGSAQPVGLSAAAAGPAPEPDARTRPIGLTVGVQGDVPLGFLNSLGRVTLPGGKAVAVTRQTADKPVYFDLAPSAPAPQGGAQVAGTPVYTITFAAATRFDTPFPQTTWQEVRSAWAGESTTFTAVSVLTPTLPALEQILGPAGPTVQAQTTVDGLLTAVWTSEQTLALLPFDQLVPRLAVLAIDGQTPVENANHFDPARYPFTAVVYAHTHARTRSERASVAALLAVLPKGNRDPDRLTVLTMTGVTAMVRMMAAEMDERGAAWAAEYVGPELASADITHISNEVPFKQECEPDLREDNFNFCSRYEYFEALQLSGVDIIGLTGNHQNDFGRSVAYESIDFYKQHNLPIYGGGRDVNAANAPLYVEHNGNRLAFLGANSYGPEMAWAEENWPGSARFDLNILSARIRAIKEKGLADLVLVELQYQESYNVTPLMEQRDDFNALVRAGADIVTGVQSHVPQAVEFTDGRLILYGLGNLFFDQMWEQQTRENLIVKHTIYDGRHISTQVLTTLLYDFGQPRFMSDAERARLLTRVFDASYWEY